MSAPAIYIISRPRFEHAYKRFLSDFLPAGEGTWQETENATDAEKLIEFAGRVCYLSFGRRQSTRRNAEYIQNLIRNGHESVLEHAVWSFVIAGVSRAFTHQLVRHRVGFAFSQLSQQYHDESEARFVRPNGIDHIKDLAALWDKAVRDAQHSYRQILTELSTAESLASPEGRERLRAVRSAARSVLPNATETTIVVTANARAVRHFLKTRGAIMGDAEMRCVSAALLEAMRPDGPSLFSDFAVEYPGDGLPLVVFRSVV